MGVERGRPQCAPGLSLFKGKRFDRPRDKKILGRQPTERQKSRWRSQGSSTAKRHRRDIRRAVISHSVKKFRENYGGDIEEMTPT